MIYYVTKYVLTKGIQKLDCEDVGDGYVRDKDNYWGFPYKIDKDAYVDIGDARMKAKQIQNRKIESLKKQIKKIEKIDFDEG